jgi:prevent-host-death family protein
MTKMVGIAEFKAKFERLLRQLQVDGEPVIVTSRGKPVAKVTPPDRETKRQPLYGALAGTVTIHGDLDEPLDPDWEAKWDAKWEERLADPRRED